jgi:23S rRNA (uracil1939-C5)-methyltransferase
MTTKGKSRTGKRRTEAKRISRTAGDVNRSKETLAADREAPVQKNEEVMADIIGLGHQGEGVGRANGFTLFIQGALPGEKVRAKVLKLKKQYGYAKLLEIVEASPSRTEPPCSIYSQCGGCQLQHLDYEEQLRWKRQMVVDNLERIGKLTVARDANAESDNGQAEGFRVLPTLGMQDPWRYRNKAQVPFGEEEGGLIGGFYTQNSHRIIDMDTCLIQHEQSDTIIRRIKEMGRELGITAYNESQHSGLLRHVVTKIGFHSGQIMVVLITNGRKIPRVEEWISGIRESIPEVVSIIHNVNKAKTNVIFGDETKVLWGQEEIVDSIGDIQFAISARSFYQVNPVQTELLYRKALDYAELTGEETVIDAYCGIGTISLFLAQKAKQVYGVEIVPEAIEDAKKNAKLNQINNVEFAVGKAEEIIPAWKKEGKIADVIVVDPPRKGCDEALLDTIIAMKPKRVVYVSCNPSTLARDLQILEEGGFRTVEVQPVDMFPHTTHVECTVLLKWGEL